MVLHCQEAQPIDAADAPDGRTACRSSVYCYPPGFLPASLSPETTKKVGEQAQLHQGGHPQSPGLRQRDLSPSHVLPPRQDWLLRWLTQAARRPHLGHEPAPNTVAWLNGYPYVTDSYGGSLLRLQGGQIIEVAAGMQTQPTAAPDGIIYVSEFG